MYCTKCGKEIDINQGYCNYCGTATNNKNITTRTIKKEYEFYSFTNGGKCKIIIDGAKITILRPGLMSKFSHGFSGEKTILVKNITAVQFKPAGVGGGYLQFVFAGTMENRSGMINGAKDENIIYFDATFNNYKTNKNAREIKEYIENYSSRNNGDNITNIYNTSDKYDKLAKLKRLLDNGILTQEEFLTEKKKILR